MKINQQRERASAKDVATQLENTKKMIRGKGVDANSTLQAILTKSYLEVQELRRKMNIPHFEIIS